MPQSTETLVNPVFGKLEWLDQYSHWYGEFRLSSGDVVGLFVEPVNNRHTFIQPAEALFRWAVENERVVLFNAIRAELLELYNDTWRRESDRVLTAEELAVQLDWQLLALIESDIVPIEFSYGAGEMFGNHGVTVEVDADLRFRGIDLRG
jgi:hypothetical protein